MADGITLASIVARLEADRAKPCRLPSWEEVAWLLGLVEELYREDSGLSTWHRHPGLRDQLQARDDARTDAWCCGSPASTAAQRFEENHD
jgi:hypothetical protein